MSDSSCCKRRRLRSYRKSRLAASTDALRPQLIVTLGPVSLKPHAIREMIRGGDVIFHIVTPNPDSWHEWIQLVRSIAQDENRPVKLMNWGRNVKGDQTS